MQEMKGEMTCLSADDHRHLNVFIHKGVGGGDFYFSFGWEGTEIQNLQ